jgi:adenylate cyclase
VALGWALAFGVSGVIDLLTVTFPLVNEAVAYYAASGVAMLSTGIFGMVVAWVAIDEMNRRTMVPAAFPHGFVSRDSSTRTVAIPQKMIALWFGVTFFPLLVLSLGFYTRRYLPQNDLRAALFVVVFLPASALLVYRVGQATQRPLRTMVGAAQQIARGEFALTLRSLQNDDIGYLMDSTIEMAESLKEKELIRETFGRAVDPRVRDHLLAGNIALGGTRRTAAVMFCDIRGFTTLSETWPEEDLVRFLNEHLEAMEAAVQAEGGMINKFLGDGFLALFGAPLDDPAPAHAAVRAAHRILAINAELNGRRANRGDPELRIGVGIHTGSVIAGNIGSSSRAEYTVIGDTVNLASRVEGLTKRLGVDVVVTEAVRRAITAEPGETLTFRDAGSHEVRGRAERVHLWTPEGTAPESQDVKRTAVP